MDLKIRVEGVDAIKAALKEIGRKAPRALTLTLNKLADDGQQDTTRFQAPCCWTRSTETAHDAAAGPLQAG